MQPTTYLPDVIGDGLVDREITVGGEPEAAGEFGIAVPYGHSQRATVAAGEEA